MDKKDTEIEQETNSIKKSDSEVRQEVNTRSRKGSPYKERKNEKIKKDSVKLETKELEIDFICREDLALTTVREFFEIFVQSVKKEEKFHLYLLNP